VAHRDLDLPHCRRREGQPDWRSGRGHGNNRQWIVGEIAIFHQNTEPLRPDLVWFTMVAEDDLSFWEEYEKHRRFFLVDLCPLLGAVKLGGSTPSMFMSLPQNGLSFPPLSAPLALKS